MLSSDAVERIVQLVHAHYDKCKFKPSNDYQYTVLAAFVLEKIASTEPNPGIDSSDAVSSRYVPNPLKVISMGTGVKCLPTAKYPVRGDALHDSHAEVLARRCLIRWLYEEVHRTAHTTTGSDWLCTHSDGKWALRDSVRLHMYISTVPCEVSPSSSHDLCFTDLSSNLVCLAVSTPWSSLAFILHSPRIWSIIRLHLPPPRTWHA